MLNVLISNILLKACLTLCQDAVHIHLHEGKDSNESKPIQNKNNESKPILNNKNNESKPIQNTNNKNIIGDYSKKQMIGIKGFIILYNNVFLCFRT